MLLKAFAFKLLRLISVIFINKGFKVFLFQSLRRHIDLLKTAV